MKQSLSKLLYYWAGIAMAAAPLETANAATQATSLGNTSSGFVDNSKHTSADYNAVSTGQSAPFNGFIGGDAAGPDFSATWNFANPAPGFAVQSGSIAIGIWDADTAAPGTQVASFSLNGTVLTANANIVFEAKPALDRFYEIYTIDLTPYTALLADLTTNPGTASLSLQGPGLSVLGTTSNNGAGLVFSTLILDSTIPEPSAIGLVGLGFGCLLSRKKRP